MVSLPFSLVVPTVSSVVVLKILKSLMKSLMYSIGTEQLVQKVPENAMVIVKGEIAMTLAKAWGLFSLL